jgi:hypothetical protein
MSLLKFSVIEFMFVRGMSMNERLNKVQFCEGEVVNYFRILYQGEC